MKKKLLVLVLLVFYGMVIVFSAGISDPSKTMVIVEGKLNRGRFLVPMRKVFEALDAEVSWNSDKRKIISKRGSIKIELKVDAKKAYINEEVVELDVSPVIVEGRTFVPFRFVGEALGAEVNWEKEESVGKIEDSGTVIKARRAYFSDSNTSIVNNPYEDIDWGKTNFYKANFHTHTKECHGELSIRETISRYHEADYDILAITSHDTLQTEETAWPWTDWDKDPEELGMLAVEGNELSNLHHMGSFFNSYGDEEEDSEVRALKETKAKDGKAMMFHPGEYDKSKDWYVYLYKKFYQEPLIGMEVYNMIDRYPEDRELWDDVNSELMPEKTVFGYSNDDMHKEYQLFNNYQYMLMEELTTKELRKSMKRGSLFFVYEKYGNGAERIPQIEKIKVEDGEIKINARDYDKIKWIVEGTEKIDTGDKIEVTELDSVFVRAVIKNSWGRVYTQPFALE